MKWYIVAGIGLAIVGVAYAASRRIPASSSSGSRPRNRGLDEDGLTPPFPGIAVGEPHPSPTNPTKSAGGVLSDGGGIMAGYPGYGLWSGGGCNCGGES